MFKKRKSKNEDFKRLEMSSNPDISGKDFASIDDVYNEQEEEEDYDDEEAEEIEEERPIIKKTFKKSKQESKPQVYIKPRAVTVTEMLNVISDKLDYLIQKVEEED